MTQFWCVFHLKSQLELCEMSAVYWHFASDKNVLPRYSRALDCIANFFLWSESSAWFTTYGYLTNRSGRSKRSRDVYIRTWARGERRCQLLQAWPAMCLHEESVATIQWDMLLLTQSDGRDECSRIQLKLVWDWHGEVMLWMILRVCDVCWGARIFKYLVLRGWLQTRRRLRGEISPH